MWMFYGKEKLIEKFHKGLCQDKSRIGILIKEYLNDLGSYLQQADTKTDLMIARSAFSPPSPMSPDYCENVGGVALRPNGLCLWRLAVCAHTGSVAHWTWRIWSLNSANHTQHLRPFHPFIRDLFALLPVRSPFYISAKGGIIFIHSYFTRILDWRSLIEYQILILVTILSMARR